MESKQDYFRSPHARNMANFYSPFSQLKNDNGTDELFAGNLFSPFKRNTNSPFHLYTPHYQSINEEDEDQKDASPKNQKPKIISSLINFEQNNESGNGQIQQPECSQLYNQKVMMTPEKQTKKSVNQNILTTSRKKYQLRDYDINQKNHLLKDPEKGLRGLSKQAFQVLQNNLPMTYQQVAQKIIEENDEIGETSKKQSQSIKRRVYDALNVLIAVGLLSKNGKKIAYQHQKNEDSKKNNLIRQVINQKIEKKKQQIKTKKAELQRYRQQYKSLRRLMNRNKKYEKQHAMEHKIQFPFILGTQPIETQNPLAVKFKKFVCGDIDAICKIDFLGQQ